MWARGRRVVICEWGPGPAVRWLPCVSIRAARVQPWCPELAWPRSRWLIVCVSSQHCVQCFHTHSSELAVVGTLFFFFYHGNWPVTQISTFLPFREWRLNIRSTPLHVGHLFPSLIHGRSYQWVLQHVPSWSTGEAQNPFQYVFQAVMTSELGSLKIYLSWSHVSCSGLQSGVEECSSNIWML